MSLKVEYNESIALVQPCEGHKLPETVHVKDIYA